MLYGCRESWVGQWKLFSMRADHRKYMRQILYVLSKSRGGSTSQTLGKEMQVHTSACCLLQQLASSLLVKLCNSSPYTYIMQCYRDHAPHPSETSVEQGNTFPQQVQFEEHTKQRIELVQSYSRNELSPSIISVKEETDMATAALAMGHIPLPRQTAAIYLSFIHNLVMQ